MMTLNELVRHLNIILGTNIQPTYTSARGGDIRRSRADVHLAKKLLGFQSGIDAREGLRRTVDYYRSVSASGDGPAARDQSE